MAVLRVPRVLRVAVPAAVARARFKHPRAARDLSTRAPRAMFMQIFDDKRVITAVIGLWTLVTACVFLGIMLEDESPFLSFGPNERTMLMGVQLDSWGKWWCVAVYTFASTGIAAFSSDAVVPWITNTIQDHKTVFIPHQWYWPASKRS